MALPGSTNLDTVGPEGPGAATSRPLVVLRHVLVALAAGAAGWFGAEGQWPAVVAAFAVMLGVVWLLPVRR